MLITAAVLFAVATLFGLTLATKHLKGGVQVLAVTAPPDRGGTLRHRAAGRQVSMDLAVLHGVFAAEGLLIVMLAAFQGPADGLVATALVLFVVAAGAGFYLFTAHLHGRPLPKSAILVHAGIALVASALFVLAT